EVPQRSRELADVFNDTRGSAGERRVEEEIEGEGRCSAARVDERLVGKPCCVYGRTGDVAAGEAGAALDREGLRIQQAADPFAGALDEKRYAFHSEPPCSCSSCRRRSHALQSRACITALASSSSAGRSGQRCGPAA